jgi:hypothetical protein
VTPTAIAAVELRSRTVLVGAVVTLAVQVKPWVRLQVELNDGTGTITLRFMGRTQISGLVPGVRLRVEGTPTVENGTLLMLNPLYSFVADDEHAD